MLETLRLAGLISCGLLVSACTDDPYSPIVDGPTNVRFQQDLGACRQLSQQKTATNNGAIGGAVLGGLVGAADADSGDALESAAAGALIGGMLGSHSEKTDVEVARDKIVFNCMRGRGHNVVG